MSLWNHFFYLEQRNLDNVAVERIILKCKAGTNLSILSQLKNVT